MNQRVMRHRFRTGFSLIEVLIVIAILLAIGGLVMMNLIPAKDKADADVQRVQMETIGRAIQQFKLDMRRYPTEEEGLSALSRKDVVDEEGQSNWAGPYLESPVLKDIWNRPLVYHFPGQLRGEEFYDIISLGPDGQEGTADDITNHDRFKNADGEFETSDETETSP
jgi:general secretion pathway protein G